MLLKQLGVQFSIEPARIDESCRPDDTPETYVLRLARAKAEATGSQNPSAWVLSADTIVALDGRLLGKPETEADALETLMLLAGREHEVRSGYCLLNLQSRVSHVSSVKSLVRFAPFSRELALSYVKTGEPMDKAGAYGIQGMGGLLVESVHGSYSNIVGLPLTEVVSVLMENNVITIS
jgi:septum formation protein